MSLNQQLGADFTAPDYISAGACFLLGASVALPIAPEARLTMFDGIALLLILRSWRIVMSVFKPAIIVLTISSLAMGVSAYLNASEMRALAGREYQMIFLLIETMGYGILIGRTNDKGRSALALGVAIGICSYYFHPSDARVLDEPIKFLLGIPLGVGLLALYALVQPRASASVPLVVGLMIGYALFCFLVGSRSIGGVFFVSALIVVGIGWVAVPRNYKIIAPVVIIIAALSVYGLTELYTTLAVHGVFGARAAAIAAFQSSYGSILLGGRPEIIVNVSGIKDAPFFGVGVLNYPSIYLYEMINLSVYSKDEVLDLDNILYHSALFATAFESGIIAAAIWGFLLYAALIAVPLLKNVATGYRAFVAPLLLITIWHILYSPPIPYNRFVMGIGLGFAFFLYIEWKKIRDNDQEQGPLDQA